MRRVIALLAALMLGGCSWTSYTPGPHTRCDIDGDGIDEDVAVDYLHAFLVSGYRVQIRRGKRVVAEGELAAASTHVSGRATAVEASRQRGNCEIRVRFEGFLEPDHLPLKGFQRWRLVSGKLVLFAAD